MAARRKPVAGALAELTSDPGLLATLTGAAVPQEQPGRLPVPDEEYRAAYAIGRQLHERVKEIAAAENVTPSDVVRYAVRVLVEDYDQKGPLTKEMLRRRYQPRARERIG